MLASTQRMGEEQAISSGNGEYYQTKYHHNINIWN